MGLPNLLVCFSLYAVTCTAVNLEAGLVDEPNNSVLVTSEPARMNSSANQPGQDNDSTTDVDYRLIVGTKWRRGDKICDGTCGNVYRGTHLATGQKV